jgi:hypothetical protein
MYYPMPLLLLPLVLLTACSSLNPTVVRPSSPYVDAVKEASRMGNAATEEMDARERAINNAAD